MEKVKNKYIFIIFFLFVIIILLIFNRNLEERISSIIFILLSFLTFFLELFWSSNTKVKMEKTFFLAGRVTINISYIFLTILFYKFYDKFYDERQYIVVNIITLIINIISFIIIYCISIKGKEVNKDVTSKL